MLHKQLGRAACSQCCPGNRFCAVPAARPAALPPCRRRRPSPTAHRRRTPAAPHPPPNPTQWATIGGVLALADYLGCAGLLQRADEWLCAESRQQEACKCCAAFELAARHRLGGCMALLLPWAVQSMARGSRCAAVWWVGRGALGFCHLQAVPWQACWWKQPPRHPAAPSSTPNLAAAGTTARSAAAGSRPPSRTASSSAWCWTPTGAAARSRWGAAGALPAGAAAGAGGLCQAQFAAGFCLHRCAACRAGWHSPPPPADPLRHVPVPPRRRGGQLGHATGVGGAAPPLPRRHCGPLRPGLRRVWPRGAPLCPPA